MTSAGAVANPSAVGSALFRALLSAIEIVGNGLRQHPANESLRRSFQPAQTASDAFAARVGALVTTIAVIDQWRGAEALRASVDRADPGDRWRRLLDAVDEQCARPAAAVIATLDGLVCSRDELASLRALECEDHRVEAALTALRAPAALRPIEASSFVSAIEAARRCELRALVDVWAVHYDHRLAQTPVGRSDDTAPALVKDALELGLDGAPRSGSAKSLLAAISVVDPRCKTGFVLLAVLRALRSRCESTVFELLAECVRGEDFVRARVALARLAVWTEAGFDCALAPALSTRIVTVSSGARPIASPETERRTLVITDVTDVEESLLPTCVELLSHNGALAALVRPEIAWRWGFTELRSAVNSRCHVESPLWVRHASSLGRDQLALIAWPRSDARSAQPGHPWTLRHENGIAEVEALREKLTALPRITHVVQTADAVVDPSQPLGARRVVVALENGALRVAIPARAPAEGSIVLFARDSRWTVFALLGLLSASLTHWQVRENMRARWAESSVMKRDDLLAIALPDAVTDEALAALSALGERVETDGLDRATRAALDALVATIYRLTSAQAALVRATTPTSSAKSQVDRTPKSASSRERRTRQPDATPAVAKPERRREIEPKPETPAVVLPRDREAPPSATPSSAGAAPSRAGSMGASGRGAEGLLRSRTDDRRAVKIPVKMQGITLPDDAASREVLALLSSARDKALSRDEVCRRAREHTSEELSEAIASLLSEGWIVEVEDQSRLALELSVTARDKLRQRART